MGGVFGGEGVGIRDTMHRMNSIQPAPIDPLYGLGDTLTARLKIAARMASPFVLSSLAAAGPATGTTTATLLLLPFVFLLSSSRTTWLLAYLLFGAIAFGDVGHAYNLMVSAPVSTHHWWPYLVTPVWSCLLAAPGLLAWPLAKSIKPTRRVLGTFLMWVVLPFSVGPWYLLHPIMAAGDVFPGTASAGVVTALLLCLLICHNTWRCYIAAVVILLLLALFAWARFEPSQPTITAISTLQGKPAPSMARRAEQLLALRDTIAQTKPQRGAIVILPEGIVSQEDHSEEAAHALLSSFATRHEISIWAGTTRLGREGKQNELIKLNGTERLQATNPMPYFYSPTQGSTLLRYATPGGQLQLPHGTATVWFCYESLAIPAWLGAIQAPRSPVILVTNYWWQPAGRISNTLHSAAHAGARLMGAAPAVAANR